MYIGRLAPSPTGFLHLGHARTFWIGHQRARAAGGTLYLRDEDLDTARVRPHFAEAMREDLRWLGLSWDAELRQSDRLHLYRAALDHLLAAGLAYPCTCSRKHLAQSIAAPHEDTDDEPVYTNRCRPYDDRATNRGAPHLASEMWAAATFQPTTNYRFRIPDRETVTFIDLHAGLQSFTTGVDFGDFPIWRKDGLPSYQLACTVDDAATGITEVVRGSDLLKSTARQMLLQRALGYATPQYFHTDLMRDPQGFRLAKRHDALALRTLRTQGLTAADVLAMF